MVFRNSAITGHNGIVATVDTHSSTDDDSTLFDELTNSIICLVGDINRIPQPFVGLKNVKFVGNTGSLFGQVLNDTNVSNIDPTSSISWTAPESSDASEVYNNSGILELYNITVIRNTIYNSDLDELFEFKYHRIRMKDWTVKDNECYGFGNISSGNENFEKGCIAMTDCAV